MATQGNTDKEDYCLECHWESFHLDGREDENAPSETQQQQQSQQQQLNCPGEEHHTLSSPSRCDVDDDDACCDVDDCSTTCPSVCDGFMGCDASTACSVLHCDENHCDEDHCDESHCQNNEPVCFEDHCFNENEHPADNGLESFLGLGPSLSLEANNLLSTGLGHGQLDQQQGQQQQQQQSQSQSQSQSKTVTDHVGPAGLDPVHHSTPDASSLFHPYSSTPTHCHSHIPHPFNCHTHAPLMHPSYPVQNGVNPADVFHMLGMCSDFTTCHIPEEQHCHSHQLNDSTSNPFSCFHTDHHHLNCNPASTINNNNNNHHGHSHHHHSVKTPASLPTKGPCRSHHRCRAHAHAHPYSPYSRHSRSSISSHLIPSPSETPPPLDGGASSVITSPEFSPVDREAYVCKWKATSPSGIKTSCGAAFADAGALQKHLIASHMATVDGAKGNGYYCCWEGCHRPDEPFSQKSKLQGHFLTHSNYKNFRCSVCGKVFARQATLDRHERSHRGEKPYQCADCGKTFTDSSELKTHSRTHSGEKPFRCTYPGCSFQTGDSSNMSSHRLTHGERRHKCHFPGCTKSFTRPDQLKRHLKSTHKDDGSILSTSPGTDQFALSYGLIS